MLTLVVGATGQLGTRVVEKLANLDIGVRALVRETSGHRHLKKSGVELTFGDLRDPASLNAACGNVDVVIATANTALPRQQGDTFKAVDGLGYQNLIEACRRNNVRQFIYSSVVLTPLDAQIPLFREKRLTEKRLKESGLEYTIFRADAFMDVAFAMMGSDIPLRGSEAATVSRAYWFTTRFFNSIKSDISEKRVARIPGSGTARHSFVCIEDVAEFMVKAVDHPRAHNATFDIGGPQAISYNEVKTIYENILGHPLKARHTPAGAFRVGRALLKPFAPAAAGIMAINYLSATVDSIIDMDETAKVFGVRLTSAEEFLRHKAMLSA